MPIFGCRMKFSLVLADLKFPGCNSTLNACHNECKCQYISVDSQTLWHYITVRREKFKQWNMENWHERLEHFCVWLPSNSRPWIAFKKLKRLTVDNTWWVLSEIGFFVISHQYIPDKLQCLTHVESRLIFDGTCPLTNWAEENCQEPSLSHSHSCSRQTDHTNRRFLFSQQLVLKAFSWLSMTRQPRRRQEVLWKKAATTSHIRQTTDWKWLCQNGWI